MLINQVIETALRTRTVMDLADSAPDVLRAYGLSDYYTYFIGFNRSNDLPYHNAYHSRCMVMNCYEGSRLEAVAPTDARPLILAALFHDFNHSGGKFPDERNIEMACTGLDDAHSMLRSIDSKIVTEEELELAKEIIRITKYPYDGPPVTLFQKIIRDADLMQVYEANDRRLCKQFRGLREEVERLQGRTFTTEEWANGCVEFNRKVVWHTDWAQEKADLLDFTLRAEHLKKLLLEYK